MADINRDDDVIEVASPPRFRMGEVLVSKGEIGFITSIGTFLQQFYIYAVEFVDSGHRVGMRAKELCTLDHLPEEVLAQLGEKAQQLQNLR